MDGGSFANDYLFNVYPDTSQPFGPIAKENLDITCLVFDFSCWLDDNAVIGSVSVPVIAPYNPVPVQSWQTDYPIDDNPPAPPPDTYPLVVSSTTMTASRVEVRVTAGTPTLAYVVSVLVSSVLSRWRKQVDCIVTIEEPLNSSLIGTVPVPPPDDVLVVVPSDGEVLSPTGYNYIYVNNANALAALTIRLPALLFVEISFKRPVSALHIQDTNGNPLVDMPTNAYGPGSGLVFRDTGVGWVYWK